jgi:ABC-type multidrug transport system fused ATPase/permease subunit
LFGGSIRQNVAYGRPGASDDEIYSALKKANAMEFVDKLPDGINTLVGERGGKLSGGQRQRIAIARAILRDPVVLILDEATSSLDTLSERLVQDAITKLMDERTTIIIAHRLSTIKHVDKIFVVSDGEIVEEGNHIDLLARDNGIYARLAGFQLR